MSRPSLAALALCAALLFHVLTLLSPAWWQTRSVRNGRDFASYYYAVQVAADGGDPYDTQALSQRARTDGTRKGVHPFLYAPPFVGMMGWAVPWSLPDAYHLWFWLHELCLVVSVLIMAAWWREASPAAPWVLAVLVAMMTAVPNNHLMGQANFPGLALAMAGLWAARRERPVLAGVLLGTACMLKMSPALLVMWWLLRRQWTAAVASVGTAVALSILVVPLVAVPHQVTFFTEVLPSFGSGDYNGLAVPIGLFGNHSVPNLWHHVFPGERGLLSDTARSLASATNLLLLAGLAVWFRRPPRDTLQLAGQVGAVGVLMLLFPVYTYEHHLVWALPAMAAVALGAERGRLSAGWAAVAGVGVALVMFELQDLKRTATAAAALPAVGPFLKGLFMELKTVGLAALLFSCARLGAGGEDIDGG